MKAYQCSKCKHLEENDINNKVFCSWGFDPRPVYRDKGIAKECKSHFEELDENERWHEPFYWEK